MATTTNFGWETPDDTDLVKDGAAAIRTALNGVDTSFVDLKGGTTGQVLSKATNTDLDFTWVAQDDSNAIQNAIVDAKGDLITATANDTPARLAVGNNGETLVADSSTSSGLRYTALFGANKNKIINGDFNINQRAFTSTTTSATYGLDRWQYLYSGGTVTYSVQTFTPGAAPVSGYESTNFARVLTASQSAASNFAIFRQHIESVRTFAGQTITVSFWAKAASGTPKVALEIVQGFGSGGSPSSDVLTYAGQVTLSTSWARYSITIAVPSISGKTIGTANNDTLTVHLFTSAGSNFDARTGSIGIQNNTFDFWGVQVEAGSVATAFQTATGTLQGELAACQRYYWRTNAGEPYSPYGTGAAQTTTKQNATVLFPVIMRTKPSAVDFNALLVLTPGVAGYAVTALTQSEGNTKSSFLSATVASGLTANSFYVLSADGTSNGYLGFSAEL